MAVVWRGLGTGFWVIFGPADFGRAAPTKSGFRHNVFEKLSPGPKNGLERRPLLRFSTISSKN